MGLIAGLLLPFLCLPNKLVAQNIDAGTIIEERLISCEEIAFTTTSLLMEYHQKQQADTLLALMYHWESNCGMQEPMMRFLVLHMIQSNTFYDDWYPENIMLLLEDYKITRTKSGYQNYYLDYNEWEYYSVSPGFNEYTVQLATDLKLFEDLSLQEQFFLEYYSDNFDRANEMLTNESLDNTPLDSLYKQHRIARLTQPRQFFYFSAGLWRPANNLNEVLGSRPEVGIGFEFQKKRIIFNTYFNIAFGNAPHDYYVVANNQLYTTRTFLGMAIGADLGFPIVHGMSSSLFVMPGLAYRFFETLNIDTENTDLPTRTIGSFSPNICLYFQHRYSDLRHFGVQARYNLVNFRNKGGSDLQGNLFTLSVIFGFGQ